MDINLQMIHMLYGILFCLFDDHIWCSESIVIYVLLIFTYRALSVSNRKSWILSTPDVTSSVSHDQNVTSSVSHHMTSRVSSTISENIPAKQQD